MKPIKPILTVVGTLMALGSHGVTATPPEPLVGSSEAVSDLTYHGFRAAPLPSFEQTPNIAAVAPARLGPTPVVRALYGTQSGFQIYHCGRNAAGQPTWSLRTPLTELAPKALTATLVRPVTNRYHMFSDFGGLVADPELSAMGLLGADGVRTTAPVWQFTFGKPYGSTPPGLRHRETVAGRLIAQDTVRTGDVPWLLLEIRGRAVSSIEAGITVDTIDVADERTNPIAASEYILRFNTRGGVAPVAATCNEDTVGIESQQPYAADYYFVDTDAPLS